MSKKAVLFSGGFDSSCLVKLTRPNICYFVDYGQVTVLAEYNAAKSISRELDTPLVKLSTNLRELGCGTLAGENSCEGGYPAEWWPYRNQMLITLAGMRAFKDGVSEIVIGTVKTDANRHRDGTREFIESISRLMGIQEGGLKVSAPALDMTQQELAASSGISERLLLKSFSCHKANFHCGTCPGCLKRAEFFGW